MVIEARQRIPIHPKSFTFESAVLWTLVTLSHFSKYFGLPNKKLHVNNSFGKRCLWFSSLSVSFLRTLQGLAALVLSLTVARFSNPLFTPLYFVVVVATVAGSSFDILELTCHIEDFVLIWNSVFEHQSKVKPPLLVIWIMHLLPLSLYIMAWIVNIFLALNPDWMIQFRFGVTWAIAEGHLSDGSWGYYALVAVCTLLDFWSLIALILALCATVPLHMSFLETWPCVIKELFRSSKVHTSRKSRFAANMVWRQLQELLVMLQIFNIGNASTIFVTKVACLIVAIASSSSMILMRFHDDLLLFIIMCYMTAIPVIGYPALYYNAYSVSKGLQRAKTELLKVSQTKDAQALLERRLWSVPTKGVWVGSLRTFERESVIIFFDFMLRTVMSIVLAWRKQSRVADEPFGQ